MINKKKVILTVLVLIIAWNAYIILHRNVLADPSQEIIKKIISCFIIDVAGYDLFYYFL